MGRHRQPDPDLAGGQPPCSSRARRWAAPAFRRLEGAVLVARPTAIYFNSTDGGAAARGQVWAWYQQRGKEYVELVYESPSTDVLLKPDNLTVSPSGGILLCEDPDRARQSFLRGVNEGGELYDLAANIRPGTIPGSTTPASWDEFAGATFLGDWLFVNIQTPGDHLRHHRPVGRRPAGLSKQLGCHGCSRSLSSALSTSRRAPVTAKPASFRSSVATRATAARLSRSLLVANRSSV